ARRVSFLLLSSGAKGRRGAGSGLAAGAGGGPAPGPATRHPPAANAALPRGRKRAALQQARGTSPLAFPLLPPAPALVEALAEGAARRARAPRTAGAAGLAPVPRRRGAPGDGGPLPPRV